MTTGRRSSQVWAIVVNWNDAERTLRCVRSLRASNRVPRVLVVDNGSTDRCVERLTPEVDVLTLADNGGYAAGCNAGIRAALDAGANYVWVLNNDTVVAPDACHRLVEASERAGDLVIVSPKIVLLGRPSVIWYAGGTLDRAEMRTAHIGQAEDDVGQFDSARMIPWATGCSLFFSRAVAGRVGPMDERYFLYLEDVDWCLTAALHGVMCRYDPLAVIEHEVSTSVKALPSGKVTYYGWRNRYLLAAKHANSGTRLRIGLDLYWRLLKATLKIFLHKQARHDPFYVAQVCGLRDAALGRFGQAPGAARVDRRAAGGVSAAAECTEGAAAS